MNAKRDSETKNEGKRDREAQAAQKRESMQGVLVLLTYAQSVRLLDYY